MTIKWTKQGERVLVLPNGKEIKIGTVSIKSPNKEDGKQTPDIG